MNDQFLIAFVGVGGTLLGVIISQLITYITEGRKRKWRVTDQEEERVRNVRLQRSDQIEVFLQNLSAQFISTRYDLVACLSKNITRDDIDLIINNYFDKMFGLKDNDMYIQSPIVYSIGDKDLNNSWQYLMSDIIEINNFQPDFFRRMKTEKLPVPKAESEQYIEFLYQIHGKFTYHMEDIYKQINRIRAM
jgi:hypothetical protein